MMPSFRIQVKWFIKHSEFPVLGLAVPGSGYAVNQGQLPLMPDLGPLNKRKENLLEMGKWVSDLQRAFSSQWNV